jgi:hypothetical protein
MCKFSKELGTSNSNAIRIHLNCSFSYSQLLLQEIIIKGEKRYQGFVSSLILLSFPSRFLSLLEPALISAVKFILRELKRIRLTALCHDPCTLLPMGNYNVSLFFVCHQFSHVCFPFSSVEHAFFDGMLLEEKGSKVWPRIRLLLRKFDQLRSSEQGGIPLIIK